VRTSIRSRPLPGYLRQIQEEIEKHARNLGLDFYPTHFEILSYEEMNAVAALGGFPSRYPHWRFGMDYERLSKSHTYGLAKIYEMVINNNPCIAYLLEGNSLVEQKIVMAHVLAHCDFFKNNLWFAPTNRNMINEMANHGSRVRSYMDRFGVEAVEQFIDVCLSLDNLIDPYAAYRGKWFKPENGCEGENNAPEDDETAGDEGAECDRDSEKDDDAQKAKSYMDSYINPPEYVEEQRRKKMKEQKKKGRHPPVPVRDVLYFLAQNAPLKPWERGILEILREEAYYFAPQGMTKIMNEGWATYWHSKIMTEKVLDSSEIIDYADRASGVTATSGHQLNPYKLGVELFRSIEERWNRGMFGEEWEKCDDMGKKQSWNRRCGEGREKIFQVRTIYNDITFIDEFFTMDFCAEMKLFNFGYNDRRDVWEIQTRQFEQIKQRLLFQLTNLGNPFIYVDDANHENRGELLLRHDHQGVGLKEDWTRAAIENLYRIWKRPVNLLTKIENKDSIYRFDGKEHSLEQAGAEQE